MIVLDTDTLSISQTSDHPEGRVLKRRILLVPDDVWVGTSIISYEEQIRGWIAYLARARDGRRRIEAYRKLNEHLDSWRESKILPYYVAAVTEFSKLRSMKIRVGTPDLTIAAIVLSRDGLLLSRNLRDFSQVPGLRVQDWTRE